MSTADRHVRLRVAANAHFFVLSDEGERELSLSESFAMGWSLLERGQHAAATRVFAALAQRRPLDTQIFIMLAQCRIALGEEKGCSEVLRTTFGAGYADTIVRLQSALSAMRRRSFDSAITALDAVAVNHPEFPLLHLLLGRLHVQTGRPRQAIKHWRAAVADDWQDGYVSFVARRLLAHHAAS